MTRIDWTELLIKILALFNAVGLALAIPAFISILVTASSLSGADITVPWPVLALLGFSLIILPLLVSLFLWLKARLIAVRLWRHSQTPGPTPDLSPATFEQIQMTAFSALGLYFLVSGIPALFSTVADVMYENGILAGPHGIQVFDLPVLAGLVGILVQISIAIALVLGPGRIVAIINRLSQPRPAV